MHSEETQSIYQRMHNGYKMYFSNTHGRHTIGTSNEANDWTKVPPNDALPITQITEKKFEIHHKFRFCPSMSKSVLTWRDFVNNLNEYEKVMLQNITVLKPTEFLQALESQTELYVCSDGALKNDKSGGGFVIADKEETIYVTGFNPDTGHLFFQTSYRSEAQAGYVVFLFLTRLCQFQCIKQPTIKYYCDNKGLIVRLNNKIETQRKNDIEIIQLINNATSNNQEYNHVYGHRNEMTLSMSTQEYLNTIADKIASNNRTTPQQIHHPSLLAVYVNKQYVPHNVPNFLLKHMYEEEAEEFMCSKYKWNKQECRQILWYQHKEVINTNIYNKRKFYIKYIHNRLPIGTLNFETTNRCPYCNIRENEIIASQQDHFICCPFSKTNQNMRISTITKRLTQIHTPPTLRKTIVEKLMEYYGILTTTTIPSTHEKFINAQNNIGWRHFVRGRIDKSIIELISLEYKQKPSTKIFTAHQWVQQVVQIMMDEHENAWKQYNTLKHNKYFNPHEYRNQIDQISMEICLYEFSQVTRQWFQISDELLHQMGPAQIQQWIYKAKALIKKAKKINMTSFQLQNIFQ